MSTADPVRVGVLDYRMSNLRSAVKALERLGAEVHVARAPGEIGRPDALVLPGVGNFGEAARRIESSGLAGPVRESVAEGVPLLGICLGMQLLFEWSEEEPEARGLGILAGGVRRLRTDAKVPHIGWSEVTWAPGAATAPPDGGPHARTYYFVHSYACAPDAADAVIGTAIHGTEFVAAVGHGSVTGVQFHPEKSSDAGLGLLSRWLDAVRADRAAAPSAATADR
jgi:glutamine amidotransferase